MNRQDQTTSSASTPGSKQLVRWGRALIVLGVIELSISVTLLLIASTARERLPLWGGIVDVLLAFALVFTGALISWAATGIIGPEMLRRSYQIATYVPVALFVALWIFRARFDWNILLPGLAWRTWLILYVLPAGLALWKIRSAESTQGVH